MMDHREFEGSVGVIHIENGYLVTVRYSHVSDNGVLRVSRTEHTFCETLDETQEFAEAELKSRFDEYRDMLRKQSEALKDEGLTRRLI